MIQLLPFPFRHSTGNKWSSLKCYTSKTTQNTLLFTLRLHFSILIFLLNPNLCFYGLNSIWTINERITFFKQKERIPKALDIHKIYMESNYGKTVYNQQLGRTELNKLQLGTCCLILVPTCKGIRYRNRHMTLKWPRWQKFEAFVDLKEHAWEKGKDDKIR
jgi:hypothetical protein